MMAIIGALGIGTTLYILATLGKGAYAVAVSVRPDQSGDDHAPRVPEATLYLDPRTATSKENWLADHGKPVRLVDITNPLNANYYLICLIQDPDSFSVAGIVGTMEDFRRFATDERSRRWFWVTKDQVRAVQPRVWRFDI